MAESDISALLCSRICHDLISPVGAIGNGVELLTEIQPDAGDELRLIGESAAAASANLQFYRLAFGAAGAGERYGLSACRRIVAGKFARERATLHWPEAEGEITRAAARLICNLMLVALSALSRGGDVRVTAKTGERLTFELEATGPVVGLSAEARSWLETGTAGMPPGAKDVHYLTTRRNLDICGATLGYEVDPSRLTLRAEIPLGG